MLDHVCTVHAIALPMAVGCHADCSLVSAGALLHDLGRSVEQGMTHAIVGARLAKERHLPTELVEIVRRHIGAGLDEQDVIDFQLPPGDYLPRTLEEKIVAHADNLVSDNRIWSYQRAQERMVAKGLFRAADRLQNMHEELSRIYGSDLDLLAESLGEYPSLHPDCRDWLSKI
ncbi:MAG: HDIG domain-containing protein [Clostridia bacterium]|nr:HDIG domain-containing protein [Clostridia bacterium]